MRFSSTFSSGGESSTCLLVFVHGWASGPRALDEVIKLATQTVPDADTVVIEHEGGDLLSNVRPEVISDRIAYEIDVYDSNRCKASRPYERIILIGHSAGALLLRKALVFALGSLEDSEAKQAYRWPARVDRIVSLAGLDRGLAIVQKSDNMTVGDFVARRTAYNLSRLLRTAKFVRSLQRGDPFIANLRVQWIRLLWAQRNPQNLDALQQQWMESVNLPDSATGNVSAFPPLPPVYQLVGDCDELVSRSDSVDDLLRSQTYVYRTVINANHASILRPSKNPYARREIVKALTDEPNRTIGIKCSDMTDVFYVIHGIRDLGRTWTPGICDAIRAAAPAAAGRKIRTVRSSYGYFSMLSFLLSADRQKNVRWFVDLYTQMIARYPDASHHYVGHSNGTYILASALSRYATCRVRNVVFAGSVAPCAFDWTKCIETDQVKYVRNDAGSADWVVGIFPHLFELIADVLSRFDVNAPKWLDLGAAGFWGFNDDVATNNTWLPGDHGAAIVKTNFASIADSVVFGRDHNPDPAAGPQSTFVTYLSKFAWLVLPVVAVLIWRDIVLWRTNLWLGAGATLLLIAVLFTV